MINTSMTPYPVLDLPIPKSALGQSPGRTPIYPWHKLEVGQSFVVPMGVAKTKSIRCSAVRIGKDTNKRFGVHVMEDGQVQVYRKA